MGAKTDQKVEQKWRSKSKAILGGFGGPNGAKWDDWWRGRRTGMVLWKKKKPKEKGQKG